MIDDSGWFDWMERRPGPPDKVYSGDNSVKIWLPHSAVGWYNGWASRLFSNARTGTCRHGGVHMPQGGDYTAYAAASVHGWVELNGVCYQHYPIFAKCWASGSAWPNSNGISFEHAGGAPGNFMQPFTPEQTAADIRMTDDIQEWHERTETGLWKNPHRPVSPSVGVEDKDAQCYEHNECTRWGSAPTACPSERLRYAWSRIVTALNQEEDEMAADERLDAIYRKLDGSGTPIMFTVMDAGEPNGMKSIPLSRLDYLNYRAYGFIISDVSVPRSWMDFMQAIAHSEAHGHVITP